jgi:hypothetical protein
MAHSHGAPRRLFRSMKLQPPGTDCQPAVLTHRRGGDHLAQRGDERGRGAHGRVDAFEAGQDRASGPNAFRRRLASEQGVG